MARQRPAVARASLAVAAAAGWLLVAGVVHADEPATADVTSAKRLFNEATALESRGQWSEAADKLREAIGIKETPGLRYHLAYAEEHMGQLVEALSDYERAATLLEAGAQAPDVAKLVGPARDRLRERTPTLLLRLPPNVAQAKLTVDDRPMAMTSSQQVIPLNPGAHRLLLAAPGHEPLTLDVRMNEGERHTLDAELTPRRSAAPDTAAPSVAAAAPSAAPSESPAAEPETAERPAQESGETLRTVVLASEAGIAVAALGVGIGYMLRKNTDEDRVANAQRDIGQSSTACNTPTPAPACRELAEAIDDSNRSRRVSNVAFVTAGVAAAAAVVTFIVWPAQRSPGVRVGARAAPQTAFVTVSGAF
jgi:tetratricopeptide (TPR) repeat protein